MSRTLKALVPVPKGVTLDMRKETLGFAGPKGKLSLSLPRFLKLNEQDGVLAVSVENMENVDQVMIGGTFRQLINNNILGVSEGFKKVLILEGVGYRVAVQGKQLNLSLGYSNPILFELPELVQASVDGNVKLTLECIDKQLLGQVAADIRKLRPPEPYKGKGIRFENEVIRRKAGKTGKK